MRADVQRRACLQAALGGVLAATLAPAAAIDNPEAPDRVASFEQRALVFEQALAATDGGNAAAEAGRAYAQFLNTELDSAYRALLGRLQQSERGALVLAQRRWLQFRDAEQAFIRQHWTRARVGSSASLSAADYRSALLRARVLQLLRYSAEYR